MDDHSPLSSRRVVIGFGDAANLPEDDELPTESMPLNMGPSHPAMHGTVRMVLEVDGEKIRSADVQVGYLHRCFEKEAENATWTQIFPYTDRLNYVSPMLNNVGYALAVEKLLDIDRKIPERAQFIRVNRRRDLAHHRSPDLPGSQRDGAGRVHRVFLLDEGARMAVGIAGRAFRRAPDPQLCAHRRVVADLTDDFCPKLRDILRRCRASIDDVDKMLDQQPHLPRPHGRHRHHHA